MEQNNVLVKVNSVVQVNHFGPREFVGCFVLVTKSEHWGIQGYPPVPGNDGRHWVNLEWQMFEYIGEAALIVVQQ